MSRIGRKPVEVPKAVKVGIDGRTITLEGPKGTLSFTHHAKITASWDEDARQITFGIAEGREDDRQARALWGTNRAVVQNMVKGVTDGFERGLEIVGVGWQAQAGQTLDLKLGFANQIKVPIPQGLTVTMDGTQKIKVSGADKQAVGQFAAKVRSYRKPEPYNGKGIRYSDEVIRRKEGKTGA